MTASPMYSGHSQIGEAAALLRAGGVVAFPTETVYGLGADISHPSAVRRIFEIKGRPEDHPLIVHFVDASGLGHWARQVPQQALRLAQHFWPGPLTLILPRSRQVPENVTGGQDTVGLRVPDHPVALGLLHELGPGHALAAPSANRFGHVSPTTAAHVRDELGDAVDMVLDGGPCRVGLESTIVGFDGQGAMILRPGGISQQALEEVLKVKIVLSDAAKSALRVPGALVSHYAPVTPLELWPSESLLLRASELEAKGLRVAILAYSLQVNDLNRPATEQMVFFLMPAASIEYGRVLYATLRCFDHEGFDRILVEAPPDNPAWTAIADRLRRANSVPRCNARAGGGARTRAHKNAAKEAV